MPSIGGVLPPPSQWANRKVLPGVAGFVVPGSAATGAAGVAAVRDGASLNTAGISSS
jgi:hypothetical protein